MLEFDGHGLPNNSEDAFCLLSHMRLCDVVAMLMRLLWKQFWFKELTGLNIGAENVSPCLIGISHFITWLHGFRSPCPKVWETCGWSCALLVATEYVTCHFWGKTVGRTRAQTKYIFSVYALHPEVCCEKRKKKLNFRWQMYLACWNTPIIIAVLFFPLAVRCFVVRH